MLRREKLGEGTFGIVYSAISPKSNTQYAVKRNLTENATTFIGVSRETDVLTKLRHHPHIVKLEQIAFGHPFENNCFSPLNGEGRETQRDDMIHFVFKQASYDLHRFIYGATITDYGLMKRYMVQMLLGLEFMHSQKIIHRDLKPSNILIFGSEIDAVGINNVAKICDFGLAKPYTYQGEQTPKTVTSWYRPPEIALGYPNYDYKVDVWSLGCIFYEMVAQKAFMPNIGDDNDTIISAILGCLPQELPIRKIREFIRSNKWRKVTISPIYHPKIRKSFVEQLGLTPEATKQFELQAGKMSDFIAVLNNMIEFEWEKRLTVTECLNLPFFSEYQDIIKETRKQHNITSPKETNMIIHNCMERKWMAQTVTEIFNNRNTLPWYNNRVIFQAMDLFDRYLSVMFHTTDINPNAIESEHTGFIHDKFGAELRFMTCLYLCLKYFSSIQYPFTYDSIVAKEYRTPDAMLIAEQFESAFIKNCLEYNIYRPTIYEAADDFKDRLDDSDIRDLIILYSMNHSFNDMKPTELYDYYRNNLRGKPLDTLFLPINKIRKVPIPIPLASTFPTIFKKVNVTIPKSITLK